MSGRASNQYARRPGRRVAPMAAADLAGQTFGTPVVLCHQIWGGGCTRPVCPPDWSHSGHPTARQRSALVDLGSLLRPQLQLLRPLTSQIVGRLLDGMVGAADVPVQTRIARNEHTLPATLVRLARSSDGRIRWLVTQHPRVPGRALAALSVDPEVEIRQEVARHGRTPPAILGRMLRDSDPEVRLEAARNERTSPAVLAMYQLVQGANQ